MKPTVIPPQGNWHWFVILHYPIKGGFLNKRLSVIACDPNEAMREAKRILCAEISGLAPQFISTKSINRYSKIYTGEPK